MALRAGFAHVAFTAFLMCPATAMGAWLIAWIQNRWMETPFWRAALQVVVGGGLVFATGVLIGSG